MAWKRRKAALGILVFLTVGLVVVRLALPSFVRDYVNRKLDEIPEYDGQVGSVDLHLIRGAYTINDVDIVKTAGESQVPFFAARKVDLSVEWRELFHRALVGEIEVHGGSLNFVKAEREESSQTSIDKSWLQVVQDLFPFRINRFAIHDGQVWFHDVHTRPQVDLFLTNLVVVCTNLYNTCQFENELPADFSAKGVTMGDGQVDLHLKLDPLAGEPKFDMELAVRGLNLVALNDFLQAYGRFNVKRGQFEVFSEIAGENGSFDGYVKPFLEGLDVFELKEDARNPLVLAWQAVVAGAVKLFKNHPEDQVATKIPVSGTFEKSEIEVWTTVLNVLRNAFVQAFEARLDKSIDLFDRGEEAKRKDRSTQGLERTPEAN